MWPTPCIFVMLDIQCVVLLIELSMLLRFVIKCKTFKICGQPAKYLLGFGYNKLTIVSFNLIINFNSYVLLLISHLQQLNK